LKYGNFLTEVRRSSNRRQAKGEAAGQASEPAPFPFSFPLAPTAMLKDLCASALFPTEVRPKAGSLSALAAADEQQPAVAA
jgi:hypothetical protein